MKTSLTIAVPPYHVQSTGAAGEYEFPYFAFHESVSALWHGKWRALCTHGVYPFTDAKVADFDPIFDGLIESSKAKGDILLDPDEYATPFFPTANDLLDRAKVAAEGGDVTKAGDLYLRAAAVFRMARFPINRSPLSKRAWEQGKMAYEAGGRYLTPPSVPVGITFLHADEGAGDTAALIQAYLRIPNGTKPSEGWPVLLFICGLDAYRTDHTPRTQAHVEQGFATLSFEIPGTGDCPAAPNDPQSPDRLLSSIFDWLAQNVSKYEFNLGRIVARGISTGGYYAMRVAHTHADRLFAVVAQGGGCHYMFDPAWVSAQDQMEYPFALAEALAYKFGYRGSDPVQEYGADAQKFSLATSGILDRPSCRLLVINGMEDSIFPIEDSFLVATRGNKKDLIVRGDRGHMGNPGAEELLYKWIQDAIEGKP